MAIGENCVRRQMIERTQISVCIMNSHVLTHLVLVGEVVGIKGLRGEKPPEEKNSVRQTGFKDGSSLTHKHKNHLLETHPDPEQNPKCLCLSLSKPPGEKYSVCVVPQLKILSAYETVDSFFMVIHLKPHQSIGTKPPKMTD